MKKVVALVGPTASGKSGFGIKLAKEFNQEIISGDSVQAYKDLNIGSAKTLYFGGVKFHLQDFLEINEEYNVFDFQRLAREKIEEISRPLIVGGTGLYIKACLYDYEFKSEKRDKGKEETFDSLTNEELYDFIIKTDPDSKIDPFNRQRLLRAYELSLKGEKLSLRNKKDIPLYDICIICLNPNRDILYEKINKRVDEMIEEGLVDEARNIYKLNPNLKAIGYQELFKYFNNELSLEEAIDLIKKNTRHYAKRQITWFKNQMNAHMVTTYEEIRKIVGDFYGI